MITISQTKEAITLGEFTFSSEFLISKGFPSLNTEINSRYYNPEKNLFFQSNGQYQSSGGEIPWKEGEIFFKERKVLHEEFLESSLPEVVETPTSETLSASPFNADRFLLNAAQSQLYQLGKNSQGQARIEFEEVREIVNGRMLFIPEAIAPNGLLQKNLQELVAALGDDVTEEAIAEFNQLLRKDIGVDWTID
ncbi:hypothetical protein [Spirulina sp. 06S082]|uniref:hypothetical protein n=1 Tax=Spirulina sp. 06S082 TaxID=3110248 RepID=UPI002B20FBCB|nr:hypothetical protein [Spirulina sp. 06S082]MEA5471917.1 hypothetical protein [Spirulina sp. 06S082]